MLLEILAAQESGNRGKDQGLVLFLSIEIIVTWEVIPTERWDSENHAKRGFKISSRVVCMEIRH